MPTPPFTQGEVAAPWAATNVKSPRAFRETRHSVVQRGSAPAAKRALPPKQGSILGEKYQSENSHPSAVGRFEANSRRSPRLSSFSAANHFKSYVGVRGGLAAGDRVMADITNVSAGWATQVDKAKPMKPAHHSFQPPVVAPTGPALEVSSKREPCSASNDPQSVQEYVPDIMNKLFNSEALCLPPADYMDKQSDITAKMRMILIDWLIEVHMKYRLRPETLHLTVNLIDRYLSKKQTTRKRLQLVGVAAMFIAAKFEEITPPELHDWVYITDNAYTKDDVLMMECNMLATLNFKVVVPLAVNFFEHLATTNGCDAVHRSCAQYILELGLLDMRMLQYKPSHAVAAALLLSNELFARASVWPDAMIQQSRHSEESLRYCVDELRQLWNADRAGAGGQLQAVHKKFSTSQCHSVATMNF